MEKQFNDFLKNFVRENIKLIVAKPQLITILVKFSAADSNILALNIYLILFHVPVSHSTGVKY